jgi:glycerol-3-phosphate acyltransferase PlsY
MTIMFWTLVGFLSGSVPYSLLLGRWLAHADIRRYGDGNPGASNAAKAGGWRVAAPALLLDYLKGAVPVGLAHLHAGLTGWGLLPVALAPVLGHAFSPWLRFRGGKAVTVTFGIWTGLTLWEGPTLLGTFLGLFYALLNADAWCVMFALLGWLLYLLLRGGEPNLLAVWLGNILIVGWKHRRELRAPPRWRAYISRLWEGKR